ncbi:MAG: hypothetical protein HRT87_10025 [Legionellales bacterium]|nr:hypothetical protein [Legionellales bacterium]
MKKNNACHKLRSRNGAILILFIFIVPLFFIILGLVINISYFMTIKGKIHNAAIAGAHAGALAISQQEPATVKVISRKMINKNLSNKNLLDDLDININIGYYDPKFSSFSTNTSKLNSVKVSLLYKGKKSTNFIKFLSKTIFQEHIQIVAYISNNQGKIIISQIE